MGSYQALAAYVGVAFVVFLGGLLWRKYRKFIAIRFRMTHYKTNDHDDHAVQHR